MASQKKGSEFDFKFKSPVPVGPVDPEDRTRGIGGIMAGPPGEWAADVGRSVGYFSRGPNQLGDPDSGTESLSTNSREVPQSVVVPTTRPSVTGDPQMPAVGHTRDENEARSRGDMGGYTTAGDSSNSSVTDSALGIRDDSGGTQIGGPGLGARGNEKLSTQFESGGMMQPEELLKPLHPQSSILRE